ncbi:MAG: 2,4-dihydroxyhept-2-ene-1,7-dioic acid aldolase [Deltaproteobacteria bacterium]|nr:2,4-dihydroxyhept-2-ene-1,7-dioic acid aldolase [Deltaproteobacteria bacterium]
MSGKQNIRSKLRRGETSIGTWLQIPSPDVAEIISRLGYDWAALDMEHGSFTRAHLPDMFRALERWGTLPFVRLPEATQRNIKDALDSGARGLIFPMIESREQLDRAIAWSLYPGGREFSDGRRGVGFSRANCFGLDFAEQINTPERQGRDEELVLVAQIEHQNALEHLDAIFSHPRLDAYMVGPYDLSASLGCAAGFDEPGFLAALALIEERSAAHGLPKGYHVVDPDEKELRRKAAEGYTFLAYGIDSLFLRKHGGRPGV